MTIEGICIVCLAFAIAEVETGNRSMAIGRHGELTEYQFRQGTWEQHSDVPFKEATKDPEEVKRVFRVHIRWIRTSLVILEKEPSVSNIAIMWNAGYGNFLHGTIPDSTLDYSMRVENLYDKSAETCKFCGK